MEFEKIADAIIEHWRSFENPRNEGNLYQGKERVEEVLKFWFLLRELDFHPNAIGRILARALEVTTTNIEDVIDQVTNEWSEWKDGEWTYRPWSCFFVSDIKWFLNNAKAMGYDLKIPAKRKEEVSRRRKYPIEQIKKLREKGLSVRKIAKKLDIPKSTIHDILKRKD